jgi:hypothetical protein
MSNCLFQTQQYKVNPRLCFVIMPFNSALKNVYDTVENIVKDRCGLACVRADHIARSDRITNDIWAHINEARLVIADLTGRNPNVFYELGLAHGCRRPVILLSQDQDDIPFDLREIRCIEYEPDDLANLSEVLPPYIRNYISTLPRSWNRNYRPPNWDGPYIKITSLEAPAEISLREPFEIILKARNNGKAAANQGYFSISFPDGVSQLKIETNANSKIATKLGSEYESWANERIILSYPIAEGFKYDAEGPSWPSGSEYFIKVSGYAKRKGFLWFYVNACCRDESTGQWKWDPDECLLDVDQRDENVYCGVIDVT